MTLYDVKGFKLDYEKVANIVGARSQTDPLVWSGVSAVVDGLNRSAYLKIVGGYELEGERHFCFIIALAIGDDKDELKERDLGEIDESIRSEKPFPMFLWDRTFGSFGNDNDDVSMEVHCIPDGITIPS